MFRSSLSEGCGARCVQGVQVLHPSPGFSLPVPDRRSVGRPDHVRGEGPGHGIQTKGLPKVRGLLQWPLLPLPSPVPGTDSPFPVQGFHVRVPGSEGPAAPGVGGDGERPPTAPAPTTALSCHGVFLGSVSGDVASPQAFMRCEQEGRWESSGGRNSLGLLGHLSNSSGGCASCGEGWAELGREPREKDVTLEEGG